MLGSSNSGLGWLHSSGTLGCRGLFYDAATVLFFLMRKPNFMDDIYDVYMAAREGRLMYTIYY